MEMQLPNHAKSAVFHSMYDSSGALWFYHVIAAGVVLAAR
jgi:hypothetical protein